MINYHFAKFGRHCGSGDVMALVYLMILQDRATKGLGTFVGGSQSR